MIPLFSNLIDWTVQELTEVGFQAQELPPDFAFQKNENGVNLTSRWLKHPLGTEMKAAYLTSSRVEIMNLMIYPKNAQDIPVFASEYISLGQKTFITVVDLQPAAGPSPLSKDVAFHLAHLCPMDNPLITSGGELPDWAVSHFTSKCVYARPQSLQEIPFLLKAHQDYLSVWRYNYFSREDGSLCGQEALQAYQRHHVTHTPGRPFLSKTFGEAWTEAYLNKFMYC